MQDVAPVPHQPDVLRCAVHTLPIQNGTFKHVTELLPCAWNRYRKSSNDQQENRQTLNSVVNEEHFHVLYLENQAGQNRPCTSTRSGYSGADSPLGPHDVWFGCSSEPVTCWHDSSWCDGLHHRSLHLDQAGPRLSQYLEDHHGRKPFSAILHWQCKFICPFFLLLSHLPPLSSSCCLSSSSRSMTTDPFVFLLFFFLPATKLFFSDRRRYIS